MNRFTRHIFHPESGFQRCRTCLRCVGRVLKFVHFALKFVNPGLELGLRYAEPVLQCVELVLKFVEPGLKLIKLGIHFIVHAIKLPLKLALDAIELAFDSIEPRICIAGSLQHKLGPIAGPLRMIGHLLFHKAEFPAHFVVHSIKPR